MSNGTVVFSIPNRDMYTDRFTKCPKEVLQKSYVDSIGKTIEFGGRPREVLNVNVTDEFIRIELSGISKDCFSAKPISFSLSGV